MLGLLAPLYALETVGPTTPECQAEPRNTNLLTSLPQLLNTSVSGSSPEQEDLGGGAAQGNKCPANPSGTLRVTIQRYPSVAAC